MDETYERVAVMKISKDELKEFLCDYLKDVGVVKSIAMFGTYNISIDGVNIGIMCANMGDARWYIKKTPAGNDYVAKSGLALESCIKDKNYIITDYSNKESICELAAITRDALKK
jgi:TfoX/Sxy family transcriptional regulator of competence genes